MGDINRRYFDALMADKQMSLRGLAQTMGMNHSQLSLTLSGNRRLQLDEAAQISQIFGVPLHEVVENAGVMVRPTSGRRVSVIGAMRGDGTVDIHSQEMIERVTTPCDLPDDAVAVQARTGGTALEWIDAAIFFCRSHNGPDPSMIGRLCFLKIKDGPAVVATIKRGYVENTFNLSGFYARENVVVEWSTPILITKN